jgi:benzoyl-CoA reductase/2-hydroxyglutaryl-CoA dehydratase subunit BcrC/BadD/HgdB
MNGTNDRALETVEKYYRHYGCRARELKQQGKRVMGYLSALAPLEIISAAGFVPVRIKGDPDEPITKADSRMETLVCPFVRSAFDLALKGKYDYLDGILIPHTCDSVSRTYEVWVHNLNLPYSHFLNVPHVTDAPSFEFFIHILETFVKSLERFTGDKIPHDRLAQAIEAYNENRREMRTLYELRKSDREMISAPEMMKVLVAVASLPVEESTALLRQVTGEVRSRNGRASKKPVRMMVVTDQMDDTALVQIVESAGARVVMDDISVGSKIYWSDVEQTENPLHGIAERYLRRINLATLCRDRAGTYQENLDARFGHLRAFIADFRVDAVILLVYKNCDPYGFEVPATQSYIESLGIPVLYLEDDYSSSSPVRLKTRIEAFLENL